MIRYLFFITIHFLVSFLLPLSAEAEIVIMHETSVYIMCEGDTDELACEKAVKYARRQAMEKTGVYVGSSTKTNNGTLVSDEIEIITGGLMKDRLVPKLRKFISEDNQTCMEAEVEVEIDADEVKKILIKAQEDFQYKQKYLALYQEYGLLQNQIIDLQYKLQQTVGNASKIEELNGKIYALDIRLAALKWVAKSVDAFKDGDYELALEYCNKAIEMNLNDSMVHAQKGLVLFQLGKLEKAIESLTVALYLNPRDSSFYYNRAEIYVDQGKYEEAIKDCDMCIALKTKNSNKQVKMDNSNNIIISNNESQGASLSFSLKGEVYNRIGKYHTAIENLERAVELNPYDWNAFFRLGSSYLCLKEYKKAIENYDVVIKLYPRHYDVYNSKGLALLRMERYSDAANCFSVAIEILPNRPDGYFNRAIAYLVNGDKDLAKQGFKKVLTMVEDGHMAIESRRWLRECE